MNCFDSFLQGLQYDCNTPHLVHKAFHLLCNLLCFFIQILLFIQVDVLANLGFLEGRSDKLVKKFIYFYCYFLWFVLKFWLMLKLFKKLDVVHILKLIRVFSFLVFHLLLIYLVIHQIILLFKGHLILCYFILELLLIKLLLQQGIIFIISLEIAIHKRRIQVERCNIILSYVLHKLTMYAIFIIFIMLSLFLLNIPNIVLDIL